MRIVAYTYNAAFHCVACTERRFPVGLDHARDCEGEPVRPVFSTDEIHPLDACNDCGTFIADE